MEGESWSGTRRTAGAHRCWTRAEIAGAGAAQPLNAFCAAALALTAGVPVAMCAPPCASSAAWPTGLELVATVDGVRFYNDTTATTPAATLVALEALERADRADRRAARISARISREMAPAVAARCRAVVLLEGTATAALAAALDAAGARVMAAHEPVSRRAIRAAQGRGAARRCGVALAGLRVVRHVRQ